MSARIAQITAVNHRRTAAPAVAFVACLAALAACSASVHEDLDERAANGLIDVLADEGIAAHKMAEPDGEWTVAVPRSHLLEATRILEERGLPLRRPLHELSELPRRAGGVSLNDAAEREIARACATVEAALLAIDGVLDARVLATTPTRDLLAIAPDSPESGRASVVMVVAEGASLPTDAEIRALVAGRLAHVQAADVSVVRNTRYVGRAAAPSMAKVGPFIVSARSKTPLQLLLGGLIVLCALTTAAMLYFAARARRAAGARR